MRRVPCVLRVPNAVCVRTINLDWSISVSPFQNRVFPSRRPGEESANRDIAETALREATLPTPASFAAASALSSLPAQSVGASLALEWDGGRPLLPNCSSFNPSLVPDAAHGRLLVFFRVSNIHFCEGAEPPRISWRDSVRAHTHIRSSLALGQLDPGTLRPLGAATVLLAATSLFPGDGERCAHRIDVGDGASGTFSGPEDPRAFWGPGAQAAPWLLVSAWSRDCSRVGMHIVRLPAAALLDDDGSGGGVGDGDGGGGGGGGDGGGGGGGGGDGDGGGGGGGDDGRTAAAAARAEPAGLPTQVELRVARWSRSLSVPPPASQPLQKNWSPFVHGDALLVEHSLEPLVRPNPDPDPDPNPDANPTSD